MLIIEFFSEAAPEELARARKICGFFGAWSMNPKTTTKRTSSNVSCSTEVAGNVLRPLRIWRLLTEVPVSGASNYHHLALCENHHGQV